MDSIILVINRHRLLAIGVFCLSFLAIVLVHFLSDPVYEVMSSVYIQRKIPNQFQAYEYDDTMDHIRILKSDLVLDKVIVRLKKDFPARKDINQELLLRRLRADSNVSSELNQVTKVVDLYFQDTSARFAKKVLDHTLKSYEEALEYIAHETRLKGVGFLKARLSEVQKNRQQLAENLQKLETASGTTDIDLKNSELVKLKSNFTQLLGTTSAEIMSTERQISHLQKILGLSPQQVQRLATIKSDSRLEAWQKQLAVEKGELVKLKSMFTDTYPAVLEKEDLVYRLEHMISQRIKANYNQNIHPAALVNEDKSFSELDVTFGKQLIELTTQRAALAQQKSYYESYLSQLQNGFKEVAFEKKDMTDLRLALNALEREEEKLQNKIQETVMEQASLLNLGAFVVLTPPVEPGKGDAVFPISLKTAILLGGMASLVLALSSIALAEFLDPRILLFERPGVTLGLFSKNASRTAEKLYEELSSLCQGLALLIRRQGLQTVCFISLFDAQNDQHALPIYNNPTDKRPDTVWQTGNAVSALAGLYALKHSDQKILYCTEREAVLNGAGLFNPFRKKSLMLQQGNLELYRSCAQENLYLLTSEALQEETLDSYFLQHLREQEGFDLILIHQFLAADRREDEDIVLKNRITLIQDVADGIVLSVSKSGTDIRQLNCIEKIVQPEQIIGNIVFP